MTVTTVAAAPPNGARIASMAHHKRGKSRAQSSPHTSRRSWEAHEAIGYRWTKHYPRWHDILYHSRPRRRGDARQAANVVADRCDPDEALWPLERKPHLYYWW